MSDGPMESPDGEVEAAAVAAGVPSICPANDDDAETEQDAFAGSAEDVAAEETRREERIVRLGGQRSRAE